MSKEIGELRVGSRVFVYTMNSLREYEIVDFYISEFNGKLRGNVEAKPLRRNGDTQEYKFPLDMFIEGIIAARDMKIGDIDR